MKLAELSPAVLAGRLDAGQLLLAMGPFVTRLRSPLPELAQGLALAYRDFDLAPLDSFADFHVELLPDRGPRHWLAPQARFYLDGRALPPRPPQQALALLEDGLNHSVAARAHQYLVLHAAVVERGGCALLLPGAAQAGKSTLCAALVQRGWRLLSDELALIDTDSGLVHGMVRPIALKNGAIAAVRQFAPDLMLTPEVADPAHGRQAMACPPPASVARMHEPAWPSWLVLPRFDPDAATQLLPHGPAESFMQLAAESPNYRVHGRDGFAALGELIDQCSCHRLVYRRLSEAADALDRLAASPPCPAARAC